MGYLIGLFLLLPVAAGAAMLKGKPLNNQRYRAELTLENGRPVKGEVRFGGGKKMSFRAHNGTEVGLRVRPICAHGPQGRVDECWPSLDVEMDDLSSRTGRLKILE